MDKCIHGFDHGCLICGFTHIDGKKVWFDWAWQEQQKVINTKHEAIESLSIAFKKMRDDNKDKQKRIDGLQARVDATLKETQHALRYVEADMRGNHEFLQMAMIRTFKSLAQALEGGEV